MESINNLKLATESSPSNNYLPVPNPAETFWQQEPHELHDYRSTEQLPSHTDILIIGAGYAGVSTAYHLSKSTQKSTTMLEARGACSGATGRNGGHLRPDLYGHIPTYIDRAGAEAGAEIARFEIAHVQAIKKVVEEEKIDCCARVTMCGVMRRRRRRRGRCMRGLERGSSIWMMLSFILERMLRV